MAPEPVDLSRLTVALSEDLGFAPVDGSIRRLFRERCGLFSHLFGEVQARDPEMKEASRVFEVIRGIGFLAGHLELREQTGAEICLGSKAEAEFETRNLADGDVLELDPAQPFTAARARNAGFERLLAEEPDTLLVQFVDGAGDVLAIDAFSSDSIPIPIVRNGRSGNRSRSGVASRTRFVE